jgi:hypothetical protein
MAVVFLFVPFVLKKLNQMKIKILEFYFLYIYIDIIFGGLVLYSYWNKSDTKLLD